MIKRFTQQVTEGVSDVPGYWKKTGKYLLLVLGTAVFFHLYFALFMEGGNTDYLVYLDVLTGVVILCFLGADYGSFHRIQRQKRRLLEGTEIIYRQLRDSDNYAVLEHDANILENRLNKQYEETCDLQDYVARWCHEAKLPLSAALLLQEKIQDSELRAAMREPLERIRGQLNSMLLGCRLQTTLPDVQLSRTKLQECVRESIRNQQFFLIQKSFSLKLEVEDSAYTDRTWLVYILDQLISNAVKYAGSQPILHIVSTAEGGSVRLSVEDNGEGIRQEDIRHIFEKGYTGANLHNGQYKSTGMGLYMTARILNRLGHTIEVKSEPGRGSRFTLTFQENPYDFADAGSVCSPRVDSLI